MKPSLLVVDPSAFDTVQKAMAEIGMSTDRIILVNFPTASKEIDETSVSAGTQLLTLKDLVNLGESRKQEYQFVECTLQPGEGKTKVALYFPSSGTTGVPKMVAIPHSAFISNIIQIAAHDAGVDMSVPVADRRFKPGNVTCAGELYDFISNHKNDAFH
jgi:long-subunit acyl-CoA synthetase (AMP-forming)